MPSRAVFERVDAQVWIVVEQPGGHLGVIVSQRRECSLDSFIERDGPCWVIYVVRLRTPLVTRSALRGIGGLVVH